MSNTFYGPNDFRNYLEHHGVLGMKWGVRKADKQYRKYDKKAKKAERGAKLVNKVPDHYANKSGTETKRYRVSKAYGNAMNTTAQNRRAKADAAKVTSDQRKTDFHSSLVKSTNAKFLYKNRSQLSDAELRDRVNRINMEVQLKDLSSRQRSSGARYVRDSFNSTRKDLDTTARKMIIKGAIKSVGV